MAHDLLKTRWDAPADWPRLAADEIQLWGGSVDDPRLSRSEVLTCLSAEERERAERLVIREQRPRFLAWRVLLRTILGRILDIPPAEIAFSRGEHGQPRLDPAQNSRRLRFSGSHSHSHVLLGVTVDRELGVDLERLRRLSDLEGLIQRCLAPAEQSRVAQLPGDARNDAFFRYWTCKEAVLKGLGTGLIRPPEAVCVAADGDRYYVAAEPRLTPRPALAIEQFSAVGLCPFPGYVGAVAWTGPEPTFTAYGLPAI